MLIRITGRSLYEQYLRLTQSRTGSSAGLVSWHLMMPEGQEVMNDLADWANVQREPLTIDLGSIVEHEPNRVKGDSELKHYRRYYYVYWFFMANDPWFADNQLWLVRARGWPRDKIATIELGAPL